MEKLRLRSSVPTVLTAAFPQGGLQSPFNANSSRTTKYSFGASAAAAAAHSTAENHANPLQSLFYSSSSYSHHSSYQCASSQSEFLGSSRMREGPRSVLTGNSTATIASTFSKSTTSAAAAVQTGFGSRSSLSPLLRLSESPPWRRSDRRGIQHHGGRWGCKQQQKKKPVEGQCRAQAASNLGMSPVSENVLDLSRVDPLLELLCSERAKVGLLMAIAMGLCNADRVVMSVAILPLTATHGWSTSFGGIVQSSFLWGYLVSPIPGGMLADRYGGKVVMGCGVALWSLATLATPWAASHSMTMLLTVRALMGLAEGVAMPCMNNIVSTWFPRLERSRAVGLTMAGFHLGSVGALLLSPGLLRNYGVAGPFWAFGLLGFLWLAFWGPSISNDPQSSPHITSSEFSYISRGQDQRRPAAPKKQSVGKNSDTGSRLPPFGLIFSKLPTWAIILANAMNNWGYFILLSWMPVYFSTVLGVNLQQAAWFSAAPWAMMAWAGFVAGACSDYLIKVGISITTVRKIMQSVGFVGPAAALLRLNSVTDPAVASLWLTAALGLSAFSQAGFLVNHQEIAPRYAGFLHGVSNTAGTLAAIISTVGTGYFIERLGSFQAFLTVTSMLYVLSTVFWNCHASGERIID